MHCVFLALIDPYSAAAPGPICQKKGDKFCLSGPINRAQDLTER